MHHPGHPLLINTLTHYRSTMSCSLKAPMKYKYHAQHWSFPAYPRSGSGWGFVVICQHNLSPEIVHIFKISVPNCRGFAM